MESLSIKRHGASILSSSMRGLRVALVLVVLRFSPAADSQASPSSITFVPPLHWHNSRAAMGLPADRSSRLKELMAKRTCAPRKILQECQARGLVGIAMRSRQRLRSEELRVFENGHRADFPSVVSLADGGMVEVDEMDQHQEESHVQALLHEEIVVGCTLPFDHIESAIQCLGSQTCLVARMCDTSEGEKLVVGACFFGGNKDTVSAHVCTMTVIVGERFRRRGIATALVQAMEALSVRRGFEGVLCKNVYVSNPAAAALVRSLDFRLVGILPRFARHAHRIGATDSMLFHKDVRPPKQTRQRGAGDDLREEDAMWMMEAEKVAMDAAQMGELPVGAVVVRNGEIIARAGNNVIAACSPSGHAEILAIEEAAAHLGNYRLIGCTLYVTLEPCAMCAGAILHARLARLVYGSRDMKTGCAGSVLDLLQSDRFNHRVKVTSGVRQEETSRLMSDFFALKRSKG